jgi:hypothetical protein
MIMIYIENFYNFKLVGKELWKKQKSTNIKTIRFRFIIAPIYQISPKTLSSFSLLLIGT